jgi:hypothetical protein
VEIRIKAMVYAIDNYYRLDMFFLGKHFKSHACVPKMVNYRFFHPPPPPSQAKEACQSNNGAGFFLRHCCE